MHLQSGNAHKEARAAKLFSLVVITKNVTDVLAKKTLNALAKLLYAIHVALVHFPLNVRARREGRDHPVDAVVPGYVGDQISDDRKTLHRLGSDGFIQGQRIHSSLAG